MPSQDYYALAYGILDEVGRIMEIQFPHEVSLIPFDGLRADYQHFGYFSSGMPFCDQLQCFSFSVCKQLVGVFFPLCVGL